MSPSTAKFEFIFIFNCAFRFAPNCNQVFLYNDHFLVYYNIQKDGAMDFSNIELNEGSGFDELSLSSTYEVARRTPEATVIVIRFGIVLACKLQI